MLGNTRNRGKHRANRECPYGCCRSGAMGSKAKTRRALRSREKRQWKAEESS